MDAVIITGGLDFNNLKTCLTQIYVKTFFFFFWILESGPEIGTSVQAGVPTRRCVSHLPPALLLSCRQREVTHTTGYTEHLDSCRTLFTV